MAGRPINMEQREMRKKEVDIAIDIIQKRKQLVTRKAIAEEMGLTIQSLYGTGFLGLYISELESAGVIVKERGNVAPLTAAEVKQLMKTIAGLQKEITHLKEKLNTQAKDIKEKDAEIASLIEQLEIERGNTFMRQKTEFALRRI